MPKKISITDIVKLGRANPDRLNPEDNPPNGIDGGCYYFDWDGEPGCIVGNALDQNGWDRSHVTEGTGANAIDSNVFTSPAARRFAAEVQSLADDHTPWNLAVSRVLRDRRLQSEADRAWSDSQVGK